MHSRINWKYTRDLLPYAFFWMAVLYICYVAGTVIWMLHGGYQNVIDWFLNHYPDAYQIDQYGEIYFTTDHYAFISKNRWLIILFLLIVAVTLLWYKSKVISFVRAAGSDIAFLYKIILKAIRETRFCQRVVLVICFSLTIAFKVYLFVKLPYHVDEVFSFTYFADKGFFHTTVYLANHIVYNLASAFWWCVGMSPGLAMRFTSILSGMAALVIIYGVVRHHYDFSTAIVAVLFAGFSFWINVYSIEGRGYMLMTFFLILATVSLLAHLSNAKGYSLFILSSIVGFYTLRFFLIPFFGLTLLWLIAILSSKEFSKIREIGQAVLSVMLGCILLYLPAFLWSGEEVVFLMQESQQYRINELSYFFKSVLFLEILSVITDVNSKSYFFLGGLILISSFCSGKLKRRDRMLFLLNICFFAAMVLTITFTRIAFPFRAFTYHNLLLAVSLGIVVGKVVPVLFQKRWLSLTVLVLFVLIKTANTSYLMNHGWHHSIRAYIQDESFYERLARLVDNILERKPSLIFSERDNNYLTYYSRFGARMRGERVTFVHDEKEMLKSDVILSDKEISFLNGDFSLYVQDKVHGMIYLRKTETIDPGDLQ